jgi:hypothetical protein
MPKTVPTAHLRAVRALAAAGAALVIALALAAGSPATGAGSKAAAGPAKDHGATVFGGRLATAGER